MFAVHFRQDKPVRDVSCSESREERMTRRVRMFEAAVFALLIMIASYGCSRDTD